MLQADLGTVVTYNPLSLAANTTLAELISRWNAAEYHHWPVVEHDQHVIGMLSVLDIARAVQELAEMHSEQAQWSRNWLTETTASQLMSTWVVTISRWEPQAVALRLMLQNKFHALPVVDEQRLVGIVTTTDFLREFSYGDSALGRAPAVEFSEGVQEPIDGAESLADALRAMSQSQTECLGVVSGNLPLGAITMRDVLVAQCRLDMLRMFGGEFTMPGPTTLNELAAESPVLRPGARLCEAAELMVTRGRQAIAMVNQAGRMVGTVTESGILKAMEGNDSWQTGNP